MSPRSAAPEGWYSLSEKTSQIDDQRIKDVIPLPPPEHLIKFFPIAGTPVEALVERTRHNVRNILQGRDDRLLVIMGPCSIHDPAAALDYARRLQAERVRYADTLEVVMRVYFEKPRTTVGWKGLINDPYLDESYRIDEGLRMARQLLLEINRLGLPAASEFLDVISPQYIGDLIAHLPVAGSSYRQPALARLVGPLLASFPVPFRAELAHGIAIALAFLIITYLHVVLGELAPKAIALQHAESVALFFTPALLAFGRVLRPLSATMKRSGTWVVRLLQVPEPTAEQAVHSAEEIDRLVEEGEEAGVIPPEEASYVRNVFELSDKRVRDIMVPRERVTMLSVTASEDEILETSRETAHTRMPVYEDTPDDRSKEGAAGTSTAAGVAASPARVAAIERVSSASAAGSATVDTVPLWRSHSARSVGEPRECPYSSSRPPAASPASR